MLKYLTSSDVIRLYTVSFWKRLDLCWVRVYDRNRWSKI